MNARKKKASLDAQNANTDAKNDDSRPPDEAILLLTKTELPKVEQALRSAGLDGSCHRVGKAGLLSLNSCLDFLAGRFALTPRQCEILRLLLLGWDNQEIAVELRIKVRTVKTHIEQIWPRLGVRSRSELPRLLFSQEPGAA